MMFNVIKTVANRPAPAKVILNMLAIFQLINLINIKQRKTVNVASITVFFLWADSLTGKTPALQAGVTSSSLAVSTKLKITSNVKLERET